MMRLDKFKKILKSISFVLIFSFFWNVVFSVLWLDETSLSAFYNEPKDSFDVVYIGSSNAHVHFNTTLAYHLYGFTTGMLANDTQVFPVTKYLLMESMKYQHPKLYVIDIAKFADDASTLTEARIRTATDSMRFSGNRIAAINYIFKYADVEKNDSDTKSGNSIINYYFSFLLYHNRWKNLSKYVFNDSSIHYKGYTLSNETIKIQKAKNNPWVEEKIDLPDYNKDVLFDLLNYVNDEQLNVLFVVPKRDYLYEQNGKLNSIISIIEEYGYEVLNFNTLEDFQVDYDTDFFNANHMNVYGATKYTLYFSKYLKEHYDLQDHRNDSLYMSWEEEYNRFKTDYKELTKQDYDSILKKIK